MSEITLENVTDEPSPGEVEALHNDEMPVDEVPAPYVPVAEVEEPLATPSGVESAPVVAKKPRGRPKGPPKPKPEPKKRGRPPAPHHRCLRQVDSTPAPRASTPYEAPVAPQVAVPWDMAAYNQSLINALVAHSQSTKIQRRAEWSALVKL